MAKVEAGYGFAQEHGRRGRRRGKPEGKPRCMARRTRARVIRIVGLTMSKCPTVHGSAGSQYRPAVGSPTSCSPSAGPWAEPGQRSTCSLGDWLRLGGLQWRGCCCSLLVPVERLGMAPGSVYARAINCPHQTRRWPVAGQLEDSVWLLLLRHSHPNQTRLCRRLHPLDGSPSSCAAVACLRRQARGLFVC